MFRRIEAFLNKANSREIVETAQQTQSSIQSEDVNADEEYRIIDENHPVELFRLLDDPTRETCASEVKLLFKSLYRISRSRHSLPGYFGILLD